MSIEFSLYLKTNRSDDELLEIIALALSGSERVPENEMDPKLVKRGGMVAWVQAFEPVIRSRDGQASAHPLVEDFKITPNIVCVLRCQSDAQDDTRASVLIAVNAMLEQEKGDALLLDSGRALVWRRAGEVLLRSDQEFWGPDDMKYLHVAGTRGEAPSGW